MTVSTIECMDYPLFTGILGDVPVNEKIIINTINQYSYCIAEKDPEFKQALLGSDVLLPDGIGMVLATRLLKRSKIKKIAGADLHKHFLTKLDETGGSCFYLGSSNETLAKIKERLQIEHPNIKVGIYSPPYKSSFSDTDTEEMINAVNSFNPDVLFVGITAPRQEKWITDNKETLNAHVIGGIGAVFDFYAGTVKRPDQIWINMGLEWFVRFVHEPKRMWKRYFYYGPSFVLTLLNKTAKKTFNLSRYIVRQTATFKVSYIKIDFKPKN
jgi:N-acetylglucosaminyldiphosphoundecaprenol N-acetyl-beta-D-mannosaminyltransferase